MIGGPDLSGAAPDLQDLIITSFDTRELREKLDQMELVF